MADDLVAVATFDSTIEANIARSMLHNSGIRAYLSDESLVSTASYLANAVQGVKLLVADSERKRALQLLAEVRPDVPETLTPPWTCQACSSDVPSGFDVCWSCGAERGDENRASSSASEWGDDDPEGEATRSVADELAERAFKAAAMSLIFGPLALYSGWLLIRLLFSSAPLSDRGTTRMWQAFGLTLLVFIAWWSLIRIV